MPAVTLAICGNQIEISARSPRLTRLFADYFRYYDPRSFSSIEAPKLRTTNLASLINIELRMRDKLPSRETLIPPTAELYSQTGVLSMWIETPSGQSANSQRERVYFHVGVAAFRVEIEAGKIVGLITPEALEYPHILANTYALFALLLMLRSRQIYHLHAAAIVSPSDELWLICGAQRAGKTTLTTALGLAGWQPISDDSLLVGRDETSAFLTPLKKYFHLGDELFHHWAKLNQAMKHDRYLGRTCVSGLEFFESSDLAEMKFRKIDHIVLPQIVAEPTSRLEPISRSEALLRLAEQSMFFQLWRDHTAAQWQWLNELAANAQCHRLFSASDLLVNSDQAAEVLSKSRR